MLTGDKRETATCIGISCKLIARNQQIFQFEAKNHREAARMLDLFSTKVNACLVIDGVALQMVMDHFRTEFLELAGTAPSVICCRCSPTQKAEMVTMIKKYTGKRVAAIGDGGNDVSILLAADVGIGIQGKEGKQASLAADFSLNQFKNIRSLI
jgi:phospholipid-translocating ATPase